MRPTRRAWSARRRRAVRDLLLAVVLLSVFSVATSSTRAVDAGTQTVSPQDEAAALVAPQVLPHLPRRVVALGDSVPSGAGCDCVPFATLLARSLASASGSKVAVTNEARDGLTTDGLLQELNEAPVRRQLATASLVTVTIGANDFDADRAESTDCLGPANIDCYQDRLGSLSTALHAVLTRIAALTPSSSRVVVTGYWNVFLDGAVGQQHGATYVRTSDSLTRAVNHVAARQALRTGAQYVDLYLPFASRSPAQLTQLLAPDGDHPSASGHRLIASVLFQAVRERLP
jgi:lysophospholipase L1-like esterase